MNYFLIKKMFLVAVLVFPVFTSVFAAKIIIDTPKKSANNRNPVTVRIIVDAESDTLSGISGNFSFPTDLYTLATISTESSIISFWGEQPRITDEKYLDDRTHIPFEGIFPGGYSGVKSAYYDGTRPGVIFSVTLIPKNKGKGVLLVDDTRLNSFDVNATPLVTQSAITMVEIPDLAGETAVTSLVMKEVKSPTLNAFVTRDSLVNNNAWYLMVHEREQKNSQDRIYVAESNSNSPLLVDEYLWRSEPMPYVLLFQDRTKYIHVKVVYSDHTYTLRTLPPVENSQSIPSMSRILLGIALLLLCVYFYVIFFFKTSLQQSQQVSKDTE